jgi:hypothetical protein
MLIKATGFLNVSRYANDNGNFVLAVHWLAVPNLKNRPRTRTRIARSFRSETKVHSLALGESASQLRLVHGFEFEFEFGRLAHWAYAKQILRDAMFRVPKPAKHEQANAPAV